MTQVPSADKPGVLMCIIWKGVCVDFPAVELLQLEREKACAVLFERLVFVGG